MNIFLDKIIRFNTLCIVGVFRGNDGDVFSLLKIKKNKSQLNLVENLTFHDFESLITHLDKKIPVLLLIDGKGILNKRIDLKNTTDAEWLNNLDYKSIHFTSSSSAEIQFLSFCRKNIIEEYVERFSKTDVPILDFYVGSAISTLMMEVINKSSFYSNHTLLQFSGATLTAISKLDDVLENYSAEETIISNYHLPLYAVAINFYVKHSSITKSYLESISPEEIVYKKAFEKAGAIMLIGFFVMLLISYGLIQYFISDNATIGIQNSYTDKSYDLINNLEIQRDNKLKILNETGFSSTRFINYYCYELTKDMPSEISFSNMDIYPLKKEIKNTEKVEFDYKTISLKGQTYNKSVFNSWIDKLKHQKWIKSLEIVSIKRDKKEVTYFELKIVVSDV